MKKGIFWSADYDQAVSLAVREFKLYQLGWRGFEALGWVTELHSRLPCVRELAMSASILDPQLAVRAGTVLDPITSEADLSLVRNYFAGKMALEELSCRLNGAGAGACDKRSAFFVIWQLLTRD